MANLTDNTLYALTVKLKTVTTGDGGGVVTTIPFADFAKAMGRVTKQGVVSINGVQYSVGNAGDVQFSFATP